MVTDIIDKDEPLRNKLRTSGTGVISDINSAPSRACSKISEIMSFLDIASAMNIISEMNCSILRKEFTELDQSIKESEYNPAAINKKIDLTDFFAGSESENSHPSLLKNSNRSETVFPLNRHSKRVGVQKGSTLMKALSDTAFGVSHRANGHLSGENFDALKKQRREDIVNIIKIIGGNATIKDIKDKAKSLPQNTGLPSQAGVLATCSEKTLQRELVSMVKNGVLKKTGEKRWSRYFVI
jgi:hypothetical protein